MSISITVSSTGEWACGNQPDARSLVSFSLFFRYSTSAIIPYFSNRSAGAYRRHKKLYMVAAFGLHPVARIVATFGMGAEVTRGRYRFFKTEEQALTWLKE